MIMSGVILSVLGIALPCWLLFALAVQALPLYIGATAATLAFQNGAGAALAIVAGLGSAAITVGITQFVFAKAGSPYTRVAIALLVTTPALFAGYHATLGIAHIASSSELERQVLALLGSLVIGCLAFARLNIRRDVNPTRSADGRTLPIRELLRTLQTGETGRSSA